ncbi:MAG: hypothetical protein ACHQJD_07710, partial [Thermoanaerobaculia bacterium]
MSPLDSGFPRDPGGRKRMLPSVTDVVRELAKTVSADPAVLFKAARSVVAEELSKVKQGLEAAPLEVLVKRARFQLEREGEAKPISDAALPAVPAFPAHPAPSREAPGVSRSAFEPRPPDLPFQEAVSRTEEPDWEKEDVLSPEEAPFRSAMIPIPRPGRVPLEIPVPHAPEIPMPSPAEEEASALPPVPPPEREIPEPSPDFFVPPTEPPPEPPPEVLRAPADAFLTRSLGRPGPERFLRTPTPS